MTSDLRKYITIVENAQLTDTLAFKNWFRNSKVVDSDGDPLVVYHGTGKDFDIFDANSGQGRPMELAPFSVPVPKRRALMLWAMEMSCPYFLAYKILRSSMQPG